MHEKLFYKTDNQIDPWDTRSPDAVIPHDHQNKGYCISSLLEKELKGSKLKRTDDNNLTTLAWTSRRNKKIYILPSAFICKIKPQSQIMIIQQ